MLRNGISTVLVRGFAVQVQVGPVDINDHLCPVSPLLCVHADATEPLDFPCSVNPFEEDAGTQTDCRYQSDTTFDVAVDSKRHNSVDV